MILASWVHFCFGLSLIMNPDEVSRIAVVAGINTITETGMAPELLGRFLIIFSLLSLFALSMERRIGRWWAITLIFPQYTLLFIALLTDIYILYDGHVMEREVNFWVLWAIIPIVMGMAVLHTIAIFERYGRRWIQA